MLQKIGLFLGCVGLGIAAIGLMLWLTGNALEFWRWVML